MPSTIIRLISHPLSVMLALSGALHLLVLRGWVSDVQLPGGVGHPELQVSLQAAPPAEAAAGAGRREPTTHAESTSIAPSAALSRPTPVAPAEPAAQPIAQRTDEPSRRPPEPQTAMEQRPLLVEKAHTEQVPSSSPAEPAPASPPAEAEPVPSPQRQPEAEPEQDSPFDEMLSDQREEVASATTSGAPVEREPSWQQPPQPPVYPPLARRRGQQGEVMLRLDIDASGAVTDARVLASSGFPLLDRAAQEAGLGWQLEPARIDGIAVASYVTIPVQFRLH